MTWAIHPETRELLRWLRQTVHQAHHQGPIEDCTISTCRAVANALAPPTVQTGRVCNCSNGCKAPGCPNL